MSRFFAFFLTILLSLSFSLPAYGLNQDNSEESSTEIFPAPVEPDKKIIVIEETEPLTDIHFSSYAYYPYTDSNSKILLLPMEWNVTDEALLTPGLHIVTGTPVLPDGRKLAEGYDGIVTWPVFRKGDGARLNIASLEQPKVSSPLLSLSGDPSMEPQLPVQVNNCITEDGYTLSTQNDLNFRWVWDISSIDASALGKYTITAHLQYPDWISVSDELKTYTADIYVLPTDCIEIYAPTSISLNGIMDIRWLYDSNSITEPVLELKKEDGTWEACEESWGGYVASLYGKDCLQLRLFAMPKDVPLTLRLRYQDVVNDEPVERTTEAIQLTIPANIMDLLASDNATISVTILEGDRDGSDSSGTPLPDQEQPAPSRSKNKKKKTTTTVKEIVTNTYSAISGLRVNTLANNDTTVLFEKQRISAEIPSSLLKNLNLKDQELLEVAMLRPSETAFLIAVYAKGKVVEDISGTTIFLPWDAKNGTSFRCVDMWGRFVSNTSYDEKSRTLRFTVSTPNTYFLKETPSPYAEKGGTV